MDPDPFIARWTAREGGAERANYQMFLSELCDLIGVERPEVSGADAARNDYVFERAVRPRDSEGGHAPKRIDLYKRGCFILEAKQSRLPGRKNALPGAESALRLFGDEPEMLGRRSVARGWDVMMLNARRQAEAYVFLLEADHPAPPFLIVCDVGHCVELYADFSGTGRAYSPFPDRKGFRVFLQDLRDRDVRDRLAAIWRDPLSLDPAREAARVTRGIARRLAAVSKSLEAAHPGQAEDIALFLMRAIFTMFASDVDLLPKGKFTALLADCVASPESFAPLLDELWAKMDEREHDKRFFSAFRTHVRHFNGNLFRGARAYPLGAEEIGELFAAAKMDWREVDPAIFGALLEQALDAAERRRLGAHYTPRAYVQRLVEETVMGPLRADWQAALTRAESQKDAGADKKAIATVRAFLKQLCATRVLDPACGTGNFLYVALELMKALEGEVLETLARLGDTETLGLDRETVDPHQFLGLELNPRAAAIAELVVWIGYLQQHYRNRTGHPGEPILRAFRNINFGRRETCDAVLTWDGFPLPTIATKDGERIETYPNARRPTWPEAEFIVGNPPFVGSKRLRAYLSDGYVEALRSAQPDVPRSADYVLYWWSHAADLVASGRVRRAGLVATNSITQFYNSRPIARLLTAKRPIHFVWATPDHPWVDAERGARVRVALACFERGEGVGEAAAVASEQWTEEGDALVSLSISTGRINEKLRIGETAAAARPLHANQGLCWQGVKLVGDGFRLTQAEADFHANQAPQESEFVRPLITGMRINRNKAPEWVIDFFGLTAHQARARAPHLYQRVLERVKPYRDKNADEGFRTKWWLFGRPRPELRDAVSGLRRHIVTSEVSKSRMFVFVDGTAPLADGGVVAIALADPLHLAVLSSRIHVAWTLCSAGTLEDRPRYQNQISFDPFPFPDPPAALRKRLREAGEELDALRKRVLAEHPDLTLTGLYGVLEKVRGGAALSHKEADVKRRGLVMILKELQETIDRLACQAYGWPETLADEAILERLVALNAERVREEAAGHVRWLRPDHQIPRFGRDAGRTSAELALVAARPAAESGLCAFPADPYEQPLAVEAALAAAGRPLSAEDLARAFRGASKRRGARVAEALGTLARYGRVSALPDGRFAARRAA